MDEIENLKRLTDLVALKMSDKVPLWSARARLLFPRCLLDLVFADDSEPRSPSLIDDLRPVSLCHGNDLNIIDVPPRHFARGGDF